MTSNIACAYVCVREREIKRQDRNHIIPATERLMVNHMACDLSCYGPGVLEA